MDVENVNDEMPTFTTSMSEIRNLVLSENKDNLELFRFTAQDTEFNGKLTAFIQVSTCSRRIFVVALTLCPMAGKRRPHYGGGCTRLPASFVCAKGTTEGGAPGRYSTFIERAPGASLLGGAHGGKKNLRGGGARNTSCPGHSLCEGG